MWVSHLILQVVLPVHIMIGNIKVIIEVIVAAGRKREEESPTITVSIFPVMPGKTSAGQDIQVMNRMWSHEVRGGGRGRRRGTGAAYSAVVVVMTSVLPVSHDVLEGDVSLCAVVHAIRDHHHGDGGHGTAASAVTAAHQHT